MANWQDIPAAAATVHRWGANVLFVSHNGQAKKPLHAWAYLQTDRQSVGDFQRTLAYSTQRHGGPPPAFGVISGPNGWHALDFDKSDAAPVTEFLELAGLPPRYEWVSRSGSGKGYGLFFRCHEAPDPPLPTGNPWFYPRPGRQDFDHFELRWSRGQTILPESLHPSGNHYQWLNAAPTAPPAVLGWATILAAVTAIGEMKVPRAASAPRQQTYTGPRNTVIDDIKAQLAIVDIARRVFPGEPITEGDETRIPGYGGLHVNVEKGVFNSMRDGETGICGDVIDLIGMQIFGQSQWDRHNPVMFRTALEKAARDAGVELEGRP